MITSKFNIKRILRGMIKKIATDILGIVLIILALLLGWLPGPGGIPLLLAGLGLLAINHAWARRWLKTVEKHGLNLSGKIFREHRTWQLAVDVLGLLVLGAGIWLYIATTHKLIYGVATAISCMGLILLLGNRKRFSKILDFLKH